MTPLNPKCYKKHEGFRIFLKYEALRTLSTKKFVAFKIRLEKPVFCQDTIVIKILYGQRVKYEEASLVFFLWITC